MTKQELNELAKLDQQYTQQFYDFINTKFKNGGDSVVVSLDELENLFMHKSRTEMMIRLLNTKTVENDKVADVRIDQVKFNSHKEAK